MVALSDIQQAKQRFGIIGNTPGLLRAVSRALQIAPTHLSVLITGESGTGKEFFPQIIHTNSHRKHGRYIAVNCGAIPTKVLLTQSFSGTKKVRLPELLPIVKDTSKRLEWRNDILRRSRRTTPNNTSSFIESFGKRRVHKSRFFQSSKNQCPYRCCDKCRYDSSDLEKENSREDLFYRLNTVPIELPPLRDRMDDILLLFRKFSNDFAEKYDAGDTTDR